MPGSTSEPLQTLCCCCLALKTVFPQNELFVGKPSSEPRAFLQGLRRKALGKRSCQNQSRSSCICLLGLCASRCAGQGLDRAMPVSRCIPITLCVPDWAGSAPWSSLPPRSGLSRDVEPTFAGGLKPRGFSQSRREEIWGGPAAAAGPPKEGTELEPPQVGRGFCALAPAP